MSKVVEKAGGCVHMRLGVCVCEHNHTPHLEEEPMKVLKMRTEGHKLVLSQLRCSQRID